MKKVLNVISSIIMTIFLILVFSLVAARLFFGIQINAVATGSMEPDLPAGSLIFVKAVNYEDIAIGDDITFAKGNGSILVTHRVIYKSEQTKTLTTQGIANNVADSPISYNDVKGKVVFSIPFIGYIVLFINTFIGKIICIAIVIAIILIMILTSFKNKRKT